MTTPSPAAQRDLLRRAAACYLRARELDDAARVYEGLGDFAQAAGCHEQSGRFVEAAELYERAGSWQDAARCHVASERYEDAGLAYERAIDLLMAAWVWAHQAHRYEHARLLLDALEQQGQTHAADLAVIRARCDAGSGAATSAVRALRALLDELRETRSHTIATRVLERATAIATVLRRPDLQQNILATAVVLRLPRAEQQWETWALETLKQSVYSGDAAFDEPMDGEVGSEPASA